MTCYDQSTHVICAVDMAKNRDRDYLLNAPPVLKNRRMYHKSYESLNPPWAIDNNQTQTTRVPRSQSTHGKSIQTADLCHEIYQSETDNNTKGLQVSFSVSSFPDTSMSQITRKETHYDNLASCFPSSSLIDPFKKTISRSSNSQSNLFCKSQTVRRSQTLPKLSMRFIPGNPPTVERAQLNLKKNYITKRPFSIKSTKSGLPQRRAANTRQVPRKNRGMAITAPDYCQVSEPRTNEIVRYSPSNIYDDSTRVNDTLASNNTTNIITDLSAKTGKKLKQIFFNLADCRTNQKISKIRIIKEKYVDLDQYIDIQIEFSDRRHQPKHVNECNFLMNGPTGPPIGYRALVPAHNNTRRDDTHF